MQASELKQLLKASGLTQEELGDRVGLSRVTIGLMARGQTPIERRSALAIRYALEHPDHIEAD